jgi:hypothetical protein
VKGVLTETGLAADFLELELTERLLVEPTAQTMATLQGLQSLGIRLAVDDFGTGYSSLNYLKRFPISTLKIAKPFVDEVAVNGDDRAIAQAVVALARAMRLATVAEGVEPRAGAGIVWARRQRHGSPPLHWVEAGLKGRVIGIPATLHTGGPGSPVHHDREVLAGAQAWFRRDTPVRAPGGADERRFVGR